jgi:hypothetical protein
MGSAEKEYCNKRDNKSTLLTKDSQAECISIPAHTCEPILKWHGAKVDARLRQLQVDGG